MFSEFLHQLWNAYILLLEHQSQSAASEGSSMDLFEDMQQQHFAVNLERVTTLSDVPTLSMLSAPGDC